MRHLLSHVIITRRSEQEQQWVHDYLERTDTYWPIIIVGFLPRKYRHVIFAPFWRDGLDDLGAICHKKNLGVVTASQNEALWTLVTHADTFPDPHFRVIVEDLEKGRSKHIPNNSVFCPAGNGITWAQRRPRDPAPDWLARDGLADPNPVFDHGTQIDPAFIPGQTYISGAAIFARTNTFIRHPWNPRLRWGQQEDIEYSRYLEAQGVNQIFVPSAKVIMHNPQ